MRGRNSPSGPLGLAYAVHVLTAGGVVLASLALRDLMAADFDPRRVFAWLMAAAIVDAIDGPLARALDVGARAPQIDGRTIDDIVDYLTFTFIPLMLVWRAGWLPEGWGGLVLPALVASLLGFANVDAKQESAGLFLGFPSYWNIVAFYIGLAHAALGPAGAWMNAAAVAALAALTLLPVRFVYPNRAPQPWRPVLLFGGAGWAGLLLWMLRDYPSPPVWSTVLSLVYVALYVVVSIVCDRRAPGRH